MSAIVFDIETIPRPEIEVGDTIKMLAEKKQQDVSSFMSLHPALCQVVAVGMFNVEDKQLPVLHSLGESYDIDAHRIYQGFPSEHAMLAAVAEQLSKAAKIVTFNGRRFDVPVLIHRYRMLKIPVPRILKLSAFQKPWESEPHVDVANELSFGGATGYHSLAGWSIGYAFGDPKEGGDGSKVAGLVAEGKVKELCSYCAGDVETTTKLWGTLR